MVLNNLKSSKSDVYMTCEGRVLRWSDELRSSGVGDGCTVQITNMMRGGGKHINKKNKAEKKPTASPRSQEPVRGQQKHDEEKIIHNSEPEQGQQKPKKDKMMLSRENAEDVRRLEETEETRKIIARLAEGSNSDMEQWIQFYTELTGLNDEHKKTVANGIRRAVEARRKGAGRETEPTAAQEQGKRVCFTTEEVQAAREWQEQFVEKRRRAQEARVEEWRKQEEKRCEEDDDERVSVVPNMEAGSSYLQDQ